jgi:hypothetical protein
MNRRDSKRKSPNRHGPIRAGRLSSPHLPLSLARTTTSAFSRKPILNLSRLTLSISGHAHRAAALGWNALALFGCYRSRPLEHLGSAGVLWAVNGGTLVELHRDWAVIERQHDKSRQVYHRRRQDKAQVTLPWIGLPTKFGTP